jgi:hypothetical protein
MTVRQAARWLIDYPHGPNSPTKLRQWNEAVTTPGAYQLAEEICPDYRGTKPTVRPEAKAVQP